MAKNDNIASVLAFEKKLVPSDGYFYGTTWKKWEQYKQEKIELEKKIKQEKNEQEKGDLKKQLETLKLAHTPLQLREKSVRGTISNRLKTTTLKQSDIEKANLQTVDSCALSTEHDTLNLFFTLKILSGVEKPSACNNQAFNTSYTHAVKTYIDAEGFSELAKRYAANIANARFLWRNRVGAEQIEVHVKQLNAVDKQIEQQWLFDAKKVGINANDFDKNVADIDSLATKIADALSGKTEFLLLEINAYAQVGRAQDVYPSEELVLDKGNSKSKKSKILYHINDIAGMHSQKIGNALRTIDTWYSVPDGESLFPIAIEPYGAVTNLGKAYREPKYKADFFTLFDSFARGGSLEKNDQHYVMAVLVRGGVFGESGKD